MTNEFLNSAVAFIVFNRPDETAAVFESIRAARPPKLFVIADAPRLHVPGEDQLCGATRAITDTIDWPCEVFRNYADRNLGCAERVVSGLNWAFESVDELIVLEDDCVANRSFYRFCDELLVRYRNDGRISMISGNSFVPPRHRQYSYYFSQVHFIWGWATWKSKWTRLDRNLTAWPDAKRDGVLREVLDDRTSVEYWTRIFDGMYDRTGPNSWAYPWHYTSIMNNWLAIVPRCNLVSNIGFGGAATHTTDRHAFLSRLPTSELVFPLTHPPYVLPMRSSDMRTHREVFVPPLGKRLKRKARKARSILVGR